MIAEWDEYTYRKMSDAGANNSRWFQGGTVVPENGGADGDHHHDASCGFAGVGEEMMKMAMRTGDLLSMIKVMVVVLMMTSEDDEDDDGDTSYHERTRLPPHFLTFVVPGGRSVSSEGTAGDLSPLQRAPTGGDDGPLAVDASQDAPLAQQVPLHVQHAGVV